MNKFPIVGIDNAGKTSIILAFQREFHSFSKVKPTKRIKRTSLTFLDKDIYIWDMGGQQKYRKKYMKNPEVTFGDVDYCFFVIDIQDQDRFPEMLSYYQLIRTSLLEYSSTAEMIILLHKFDPEIATQPSYIDMANAAEQKLTEISHPLSVSFYRTSIFNPLTIIQAFSQAIMGNSVISQNLKISFQNFIETHRFEDVLSYILVFTSNLIEIGSYVDPDIEIEQIQKGTMKILEVLDEENMELNTADLSISAKDLDIQIMKDTINDRAYFFIFGYKPKKIQNLAQFGEMISNFQQEVKKLMLFM